MNIYRPYIKNRKIFSPFGKHYNIYQNEKPKVDIIRLYEGLTGNSIKRVSVKLTMVLCPLHEEKHPSCALYPETSSFNCFVCNIGGDAFVLIEKIKKCGFKEALEIAKNYEQ